MSGPEFFQTGMGKTFFEGTLPRMVRAIERVATALEAQQEMVKEDIAREEKREAERAAEFSLSADERAEMLQIARAIVAEGEEGEPEVLMTRGDRLAALVCKMHGVGS